jgi:hypothetical protein
MSKYNVGFKESFTSKTIYVLYDKSIGAPIPFKHKNKNFLQNCICIPMNSYGNRVIDERLKIDKLLEESRLFDVPSCYYDENLNKLIDFTFKINKNEDANIDFEIRQFSFSITTKLNNWVTMS